MSPKRICEKQTFISHSVFDLFYSDLLIQCKISNNIPFILLTLYLSFSAESLLVKTEIRTTKVRIPGPIRSNVSQHVPRCHQLPLKSRQLFWQEIKILVIWKYFHILSSNMKNFGRVSKFLARFPSRFSQTTSFSDPSGNYPIKKYLFHLLKINSYALLCCFSNISNFSSYFFAIMSHIWFLRPKRMFSGVLERSMFLLFLSWRYHKSVKIDKILPKNCFFSFLPYLRNELLEKLILPKTE